MQNTSYDVQIVKNGPAVFCTAHPFTQPRKNPMLYNAFNRSDTVSLRVETAALHVIHVSCTTRPSISNRISIGSAVFAQLTTESRYTLQRALKRD